MPRCVIPLGYALGIHPCVSRESKGHPAHVWTSSCLQLAPNALEVQISSAVCTDLQKAKSYSLKYTQCRALSTEQKPSAMPSQAGKVTGWPKGFVINRLIFSLAPAVESVSDGVWGCPLSPHISSPMFPQGHQRMQAIAQARNTVLAQGAGDALEPGTSKLVQVPLKDVMLILL